MEFAKWNTVLYVNSPLDRITKWRSSKSDPKILKRIKIIKHQENGLKKITDNLYEYYPDVLLESINWIPMDTIFDFLNCINNKRFAESIKTALQLLSFDSFILFNDSDMFRSYYLIELLKPKLSIYYSRDNMLATDYFKKHGKKFEPKIIAKNNLCVANSAYLMKYCLQYNDKSFNIGQGCDLEILNAVQSYKLPNEVIDKIGPKIGYVGVLTSTRLDIELIQNIALARPDWNIFLVGPEDEDFKKSRLHDVQNVYFLGAKPIKELPAYIDAFNVCFNPQILNALTIGNYPRKIDEYLALGKPTIATKTETMETFKQHVYLADDLNGYIIGIESLIKNNSEQAIEHRKSFAKSHTWENSVNSIYRAIDDTKLLT
ncbi:MAG: glycosyltransferase [Pedobacter sp.]|nr:MAG: glycosyltransferase [Pedobacter sp.]